MGKHESVEGIEDQVQTLVPPSEAPPMAPSMIDRGPALEPTRMALAAIEALKIEPPTGEAPRIELSGIASMPRFTAPPSEEIRLDAIPTEVAEAASEATAEAGAAHEEADHSPRRVSAFTMMAASLAAAAAVGAMIGAVVASGIARPTPVASAPGIGIEDVNALKEQVVQARVELAALKSNIDAGHRSANQQFTRIAERVERMERTQAEPVAKLSKAVEALEKVRRAELALHADAMPTGSITPPQPIAGAPKPGPVEGWVLRDVHRGTAFIEGRMGIIEVDQGDMVPGLGRVEAIRKQDGKWVVVTSKGLIVPPPK